MEELKKILQELQETLRRAEKIREADINEAVQRIKSNNDWEEMKEVMQVLIQIRDTATHIIRVIGPIREDAISRRIEIENLE
jgi:precorrin-3B methylase